MNDYYVRITELPDRVGGVSVPNNDGSFDIYINSLLPPGQQQETLEHELEHIRREHFYLDIPIGQIERQAEGESVNAVLHPPEGKLPCFPSEAAFAHWLSVVLRQKHIDPDSFTPER